MTEKLGRTKLAKKIRECGYPAYVVGAAARIHPAQLSYYTTGTRLIPPHHLHRLAQVLDCDVDDLLGVEE